MAKAYNDLDLGVLTMRRLTHRDDGRRLLMLLSDIVPSLAPQKYSNHEPIRTPYNPDNLEEALASWRNPFLWNNRASQAHGSAWIGEHPNYGHDSIHISARSRALDLEKVTSLLESLAVSFSADFAYLHCMSLAEVESKPPTDVLMPFRRGINTFDLRKGIPNLAWATIFGRPYVELFSRERILSTPVHRVVEIAPQTYCLLLTPHLTDVATNYPHFEEVRSTAKRHLDCDAFLNVEPGSVRPRRIPAFQ